MKKYVATFLVLGGVIANSPAKASDSVLSLKNGVVAQSNNLSYELLFKLYPGLITPCFPFLDLTYHLPKQKTEIRKKQSKTDGHQK